MVHATPPVFLLVLQCFVGHHRAVATFGLITLLLVGVCFPLIAAVALWLNRKRLDDWNFAWKVSSRAQLSRLKPTAHHPA